MKGGRHQISIIEAQMKEHYNQLSNIRRVEGLYKETNIFYKITNFKEKTYDPKLKNMIDVERDISNYLNEFIKNMN